MITPAAIVIVNDNITDNISAYLSKQLQINEVIDGYTFDQRILANSNYIADIKQLNLRIMVKRSLAEFSNRDKADIVITVKHGLIAVEKNKFGPHSATLPILNINWADLGVY